MEGKVVFGVDSHIIHVDLEPFLHNHVRADVVHESLECGRGITEAEEHDSWFEQSQGSYEKSFPLVLLLKVDVIVSPMYIKLGEDSGVFHIINEFWDQGQWVGISNVVRI